MPLHQEIEGGQRKRQARLESGPRPMQHLLEMTDPRQHRQHSLDQHPSIPGTARTELEIGRVTILSMKAGITQNDHLLLKGFNQGMESAIWGIRASTVPGHHQPQVIEQQAQVAPDDPAVIGFALAPDSPPP